MSDSSKTQVRIFKETTWGETPSTSNKMKNLNVTSENLSQQTNTARSQNINSTGNTQSINRVGIGAGGDIGVEMNFGVGLEYLMEGCMRSTFATAVAISGTTFSAAASDNSFNDSGSGFVSGNVLPGQWLKVGGFTTAANNGYFRVLSVVAGKIVVEGGTLVDEAAGDTVTMKGALLKNGTTDQSFLVEVERNDITIFKYFTGMRVGQNQFTFTPNSLVTGSFTLRGKQMQVATATQGDGSPTAADTTRSMNAVDNIKGVYLGTSLSTLDVTNFNFSISPALRDKAAIGNLAMVGIGSGTQIATINLEAYLEDETQLQDYLNFTETSLALVIEDGVGNAYIFDFPSVVPATGEDPTGGLDQDVIQRLSYEAFLDTTINATIGITKIAA